MGDTTTIWRTHARSGATPPENYERYFVPVLGRPFGVDLVRAAALRPGERVLDVGCGTGLLARLAAPEVGPDARVTGVDVNAGMLAVARRIAEAEGLAIEWHEAGAEAIPLPDEAFDVVLCQMALQFVEDRPAAVSEMRRVLVPGGRALVNLPRPNSLLEAFGDALAAHAGEEAAGFVRAVFSLSEPDRIEGLLREAGFREVDVREERKEIRLPPAGAFLWQYAHSTPLAGLLAGLGEDGRRALEEEIVARWRPWSEDGAVTYRQAILVGRAVR